MTQKKHRVMTNSWSHDEMWMDTKLEKLEGYESEHLRDLWKDVLIWLDELTGEKK